MSRAIGPFEIMIDASVATVLRDTAKYFNTHDMPAGKRLALAEHIRERRCF